jgi:regulator of replication initiation timing
MKMKFLSVLIASFVVMFCCVSCSKEVKGLKEEMRLIKEENNFLKAENIGLKKEIEELYKKLEEKPGKEVKDASRNKAVVKEGVKPTENIKVEEGVKKKP